MLSILLGIQRTKTLINLRSLIQQKVVLNDIFNFKQDISISLKVIYFELKHAATNFDVLLTVHLSIFISVFNQLDAQSLFRSKFYFMPLHVLSTCAHHQEVKIALHSLGYHHTYMYKILFLGMNYVYKACNPTILNLSIN